jgi:large subunit ribosomal protein L17
MRHSKHKHLLGVKSAHRLSLMANMCCALIENGRIRTTLAKAKALRPSIEKIITLAKKAHLSEDVAKKVHYRRLAIARLRNKKSVKKLFDELAESFVKRTGGYTRIYKLAIPRLGDAADMAIIELVKATDKGYGKRKGSGRKSDKKSKSPSSKLKKNPKGAPDDTSESETEVKEDTLMDESSTPPVVDENISDSESDNESEAETNDLPDDVPSGTSDTPGDEASEQSKDNSSKDAALDSIDDIQKD